MDDEHHEPEPGHEPASEPDAESTPFDEPAYERIERGIDGPWESRADDED
jgi:hypothetical protein